MRFTALRNSQSENYAGIQFLRSQIHHYIFSLSPAMISSQFTG